MRLIKERKKTVTEYEVSHIVCDYCGESIWKKGNNEYKGTWHSFTHKITDWLGIDTSPFTIEMHDECWKKVQSTFKVGGKKK